MFEPNTDEEYKKCAKEKFLLKNHQGAISDSSKRSHQVNSNCHGLSWDVRLNQIPEDWDQVAVKFSVSGANGIRDRDIKFSLR